MITQAFTPRPILTVIALSASLMASQALASAENEYTLSSAETNATVTTYQDTYQTQTLIQPYQPEPIAAAPAPQFGEIIYDTQPYLPGAAINDPNSYTTQPYTSETIIQPIQPSLQPVTSN